MSNRLAEIRARLDAATVAGWGDEKWVETFTPLRSVGARFVANAPADIAWLLDEVERLREYAVHKHNDCWQTGKCTCGLVDS